MKIEGVGAVKWKFLLFPLYSYIKNTFKNKINTYYFTIFKNLLGTVFTQTNGLCISDLSNRAKLSFLLMIIIIIKLSSSLYYETMIPSNSPGGYWKVYSHTKCPHFYLFLTNFLLSALPWDCPRSLHPDRTPPACRGLSQPLSWTCGFNLMLPNQLTGW